jgi:DNA-directed RNA polymerase specialized sigma24 family protein
MKESKIMSTAKDEAKARDIVQDECIRKIDKINNTQTGTECKTFKEAR